MGQANKLASTYLVRPATAIAICALVAFGLQDASTTLKQLSLGTPVAAGLGLSLVDMDRHAFASSGYAGAVAFGFVAAALDVADSVTGYDITFLAQWALLSAFTGFFVYAVSFVWAAIGGIRTGIDEIADLRSRAEQHAPDDPNPVWHRADGGAATATVESTGPGGAGAPGEPMAAIQSEPPPNFKAEELVASLQAYQVNGQPWWKSDEPNVMVQYRDRAQLEIESRVAPGYGWQRAATRPPRQGVAVQRKRGMFSLSFSIGQLPDEDSLTVLWTRG